MQIKVIMRFLTSHESELPSFKALQITNARDYVFALAPSLHSFWSYFSTDLQEHIGHLPTWGSSSFSVLSFCLVILFLEFSRQEYWSGLPFPSPVVHVLSELSTMTHPSWGGPMGMVHSFVELDKAVVHVIRLVSFLWPYFAVCLPSDGEE